MDIELKLEKPERKMAWVEGFVMGMSYFMGQCLGKHTIALLISI